MLSIDQIHTIIVWSTNPTKVNWIYDLFAAHTWTNYTVEWVAAPSWVSDMPMSREETKLWARNRAVWCKENCIWDMFVWWEWWVYIDDANNCWLFSNLCFLDRTWYMHEVMWTQYMLPPIMSERIIAGEELWPIWDDLLWETDIKKKWWVVWYLTWNKVPRKESYLHTAYHGIIPWLHPELYK